MSDLVAQAVDEHACPWPGCNRSAQNRYWGCAGHWSLLPGHLKLDYMRAVKDQSEVGLRIAAEAIDTWIKISRTPRPQTELPAFASGVTDQGKVFLFWPRDGQYIEITRDEATLALRSIRAMLTKSDPAEFT